MQRKRRALRIILTSMLFLLLSGCWSSDDIQDYLYATALGIDYDGEQFTAYVQFVDFENLSVAGAGTGNALAGNYVGKGTGMTLNEAVAQLYQSAQAKVEWGHMTAIVVSERALSLLDSEVIKSMYRFPETRYNVWLYVTNEPLDSILKASSLYNATSIYTILHDPVRSHQQNAGIPPLLTFKYMLTTDEPDRLVYVPMIGIVKNQWESESKNQPMLMVKGALFRATDKKSISLTNEELVGFKWLHPKINRLRLVVKDEEAIYSTLNLVKKEVKIKSYLEAGQVKFNVQADYIMLMNEYIKELSYEKTVNLASQILEDEIRKTYALGLENKLDLFNLMHAFRLQMPNQWKHMTDIGEEFILTESSLHDVQINVKIVYNGKYKRRL